MMHLSLWHKTGPTWSLRPPPCWTLEAIGTGIPEALAATLFSRFCINSCCMSLKFSKVKFRKHYKSIGWFLFSFFWCRYGKESWRTQRLFKSIFKWFYGHSNKLTVTNLGTQYRLLLHSLWCMHKIKPTATHHLLLTIHKTITLCLRISSSVIHYWWKNFL